MLFYLRIVGVFNPSKMDESGTNIGDTADKKTKNQNVVYNLPVFLVIIIVIYFKGYGLCISFIVTVNHVDTCIDQIQVSTQLHIAGVEHIGEQRKIVFVTVAGYIIILIG